MLFVFRKLTYANSPSFPSSHVLMSIQNSEIERFPENCRKIISGVSNLQVNPKTSSLCHSAIFNPYFFSEHSYFDMPWAITLFCVHFISPWRSQADTCSLSKTFLSALPFPSSASLACLIWVCFTICQWLVGVLFSLLPPMRILLFNQPLIQHFIAWTGGNEALLQ